MSYSVVLVFFAGASIHSAVSAIDTASLSSWLAIEQERTSQNSWGGDVSAEWEADAVDAQGLLNRPLSEINIPDIHLLNRKSSFTLAFHDFSHWRLNIDLPKTDEESSFMDFARNGNIAWKLTPTWLVLLDPSKPSPVGHPLHEYFRNATAVLQSFRFGALAAINTSTPSAIKVLSNNQWQANWNSSNAEGSLVVEGRWDERASRGFIETVRITSGDRAGTGWRFFDWHVDAASNLWVASHILEFHGAKDDKSILISLLHLSVTANVLDLHVRTPTLSQGDVLRSNVKIISMTDLRDPMSPNQFVLSDGTTTTVTQSEMDEFAIHMKTKSKIAVWLLIVGATSAIVLLRLVKRSAT
ncbi:MAG TPA: hypothetical protein VG711_04675 [Phycisphaerales bacterium]|nr:hypothetical protein [Phycisphaerales bacterium]